MKKMITALEDWFYKQSIQQRLIYISFGLVFIAILGLNYFFPIYADDMMYSVVKFKESIQLGENLREIAEFMYNYYFIWGGRVVAHIVAHLLLMCHPIIQALINSMVFCLMVYLVYKIAVGNQKAHFLTFAFVAIAIFYFTPSFLSSAVWKTGSANYLWTATFSLAFIYPYFRYVNGRKYSDSLLRIALFLPFGILTAWSNENTGPTLFLLVISLLAIIYFYKNEQIPRWAVSGLLGVIIGCCLMILAPGNGARAEAEGYAGLFNSLENMLDRLPYIVGSYEHFLLRPFIIYVVCLALHQLYTKDIDRKKDTILYSLMFFVIANLSLWITILAPSFPPRAFMIITVLTIVAIGILYANIDFRKMLPKVINLAFLAVLILYATVDYITYLKGVYFLSKEMTKREKVIEESVKEGKSPIVFESIYMDYRFEYSDFANYYKDYYGVDVHFVDKGDPRLNK